ncbi:MAG: ribose 5-phosphate isomerase B [Nitrospirae bacterium]|nr:ribose 5-phosphate isomerase B [Nitrospirota bacterium]
MKIVIGADHGGYHLKKEIIAFLKKQRHKVIDIGAYDAGPSDYPDFARLAAEGVIRKKAEKGIIICGSGVGASVAANKFPGIRAAICHDTFSARQGVEDDDMNVLCLGARVIGPMLAQEIVKAFLSARFSEKPRHRKRLKKVRAIEKEFLSPVCMEFTSSQADIPTCARRPSRP